MTWVEGVHEELNNDPEDISNICFDYEDPDKIPVKGEIKEEIKTEPLDNKGEIISKSISIITHY